MPTTVEAWKMFEKVTWQRVLLVLLVLLLARLLSVLIVRGLRAIAEAARPRRRLAILRWLPITRLLVGLAAAIAAIPILVEPTVRNVIAIAAALAVALAFAFKDYGSSIVAGIATILENAYQPGDWIEIDGVYGEVTAVNLRAVRVVTADDTEVTIPHLRLWSAKIANATSGNRSLLCVASFYLHPEHDGEAIRRCLADIVESSQYRKPDSAVTVFAQERPWGTEYRLKAYVRESREQFAFVTDLTIRGKEALRQSGVRFALAPYAETSRN
jgi:small-conductance mechanosensitive channel